MSDDGGSIARIISGSSIIFIGQVLHKAIAFFASVFIARLLGDTGYGLVALVLVFYFVGTSLFSLGLSRGIARNYPQASSPPERRGILVSSFQIATVVAVGFAVALFLSADIVAEVVFQEPNLATVLRIIALAIPLNVVSKLAQGTIQALKRPMAKTLIQSIINPIVRSGGIVIFVLAGYRAAGVAGAYLVATGVTAMLSLVVVVRHTSLLQFGTPSTRQYRSLLSFSLPLVGSTVLWLLMNNIDTLLIGVFRSTDAVGQYNVAYTFGEVTLLFYLSLGFMYLPEVSELFGEGRLERARVVYQSMTKWIFFLSLPFILVALAYPSYVITFIYSDTYEPAVFPFLVLVGGFLTHLIVGQNEKTLIAFGENRVIFSSDAATLLLNIVLNIILIPQFGIVGAAVATASAYVIRNIALTVYLRSAYGLWPFTWRIPVVAFPVCVVAVLTRLVTPEPTLAVIVASTVIFVLATGLSYTTFGVESEDIMIAELFEEQTGISLDPLRRLHNHFS